MSIATIAVFARALPYPLQRSWDDGRFIVDNPQLRSVSFEGLRFIFGAPRFEAYHPLHLLSYWLDVPLAGAHPFTLHAVSLLLWVVALNVWRRPYARLGLSASAAVIATLAVGLHPIQVEAVSWASDEGRTRAALRGRGRALSSARGRAVRGPRAVGGRVPARRAVQDHRAAVAARARTRRCLAARAHLGAALRAQAASLLLATGLAAGVVTLWAEHEMIRGTAGGMAALPARVVATVQHSYRPRCGRAPTRRCIRPSP